MSRRFSILVATAAVALSHSAALAQDAGYGLRRLTPPPLAGGPPRRVAPPRPATAAPAVKTPAASPAAAQPAPGVYPRVSTPTPTPTPAAPRAPSASPPPLAATAAVPPGGRPVIIIDSRRIGDPAGAVNEVTRASRMVEQEFAPRTDALLKLKAEAEATQAAADAAKGRNRDLTAKARLQKAEFDTRNTALDAEFRARTETLLAPIQVRINDALRAFAMTNGAVMVLDGAQFNSAVIAMRAGVDPQALDLTTSFIDSYNRAHP